MAKYVYPAIFTEEDNKQYSVSFPDLENCFTCGNNLADSIENAMDVLGLMLTMYEDEKTVFSPPSNIKDIKTDEKSFVSMITCIISIKILESSAPLVDKNLI